MPWPRALAVGRASVGKRSGLSLDLISPGPARPSGHLVVGSAMHLLEMVFSCVCAYCCRFGLVILPGVCLASVGDRSGINLDFEALCLGSVGDEFGSSLDFEKVLSKTNVSPLCRC